MSSRPITALPNGNPAVRKLEKRYGVLLTPGELAGLLRFKNMHSMQTVLARARKKQPDQISYDMRVILAAEKRIGRQLRYESAILARILGAKGETP